MDYIVKGNTSGLKKSIIEALESIYEDTNPEALFCSFETMEKICMLSHITNREIAVYISAKHKVMEVAVGDSSLVKSELSLEKNMRMIHTHPGEFSSAVLSDVDLRTLEWTELSAMASVNINHDGSMKSMYCALKDEEGKADIYGPYRSLNQTKDFMEQLKISQKSTTELHEVEQAVQERLVAVGLNSRSTTPLLDELKSLIETAGGVCVDSIIQNKDEPDPAFYVGKGKLLEIMHICSKHRAHAVVFDDELTYSQQNNIQAELNIKVLDRTAVILDIFSKRAHTIEGKLQVELAMLEYIYPRLTGKGIMLSRLGGGIGTRGPGETKLETDRRHIRRRITYLKKQLEQVDKRRQLTRESKQRKSYFTFALAGYTNAGKSTLLNKLTDSGVFTENMLFATLDPTARSLALPSGKEVMLIDTVGFISKLPVKLVDAFKSTLDEIRFADCIIHVIDAASPEVDMQIEEVYSILNSLGARDIPVIEAVNKIDLNKDPILAPTEHERAYISAATGEGLDKLLELMDSMQESNIVTINTTIPYTDGKLLSYVYDNTKILQTVEQEDGINMTLELSKDQLFMFDS